MKPLIVVVWIVVLVLLAFSLGFDAGGASVVHIQAKQPVRQTAAPGPDLSPEDAMLLERLRPHIQSYARVEVRDELHVAADTLAQAGQSAMPNLFGAEPAAGSVLGDQIVDFTKKEIRGMTVSTALLVFRNYWWAVLMIGTALMTAAAWMTKREARTVLAGMAPPPPSVTNTFVIAATQVAIPVPVKSGS